MNRTIYLNQGKEPVGFGFGGHFSLENVWENQDYFLLKVTFAKSSDGGHFVTRKGMGAFMTLAKSF